MKYRRLIAVAVAFTAMISAISCGKDVIDQNEKDSNPQISTESTTNKSSNKLDWGDSSNNKQPQNNGNQNNNPNMQQNGNPNGNPNGMPNGNPNGMPNGNPNGNPNGMPNGNPNGGNGGNFWGNSGGNSNYNNNYNNNYNGSNGGWVQSSGGNTWGGVPSYYGGGFSGYNGDVNQNSGNEQENTQGEQPQNQQPETQPVSQITSQPSTNSTENTTVLDNSSYTAEVTLGEEVSIKGSNVKLNGKAITITTEGDYIFTGTLNDGCILVDTESPTDKVTIVLNGVSIANSSGPAILIDEAKKCTTKVKDGTANFLVDGGDNKIYDGAIFSNDTLRLKGNGELYITANNAHGIACDDDIVIDNGTYNIMSAKSGIYVHDDITINGGRVNIKGGTNGIKSKGTININGGCTMISGGSKAEKRSIYAMGTFSYTGGYVYAAGNQVSVPTYSEKPYVVVDLGEAKEAGSSVEMVLNGIQMASFIPHTEFRCLMILAPEIASGNTFYTVINGENSNEFTVEDGQNLFTLK